MDSFPLLFFLPMTKHVCMPLAGLFTWLAWGDVWHFRLCLELYRSLSSLWNTSGLWFSFFLPFFYFTVGPRSYVSILSYYILSQCWAEEAAAESYSFQAAMKSRWTMDATMCCVAKLGCSHLGLCTMGLLETWPQHKSRSRSLADPT